jgi:hypothetical protein
MRETARSIAAAYAKDDRICLDEYPDPGTIVEVRCATGRIQYRAAWDSFPDDDTWYNEGRVRPLGGEDD